MATKLELAVERSLAGPDEPMSGEVVENILLTGILAATEAIAGGSFSGTATHINSSITAGGTAQTLLAAGERSYFYVRNTSAGDLRVTFDGATPSVSVGLLLKTGEAWENPSHWCPQAIIKVWGATTSQAYEANYA